MTDGIAWQQKAFGRLFAQDSRAVYAVRIHRTDRPRRPWIVELMKHGSRHLGVSPSYCSTKDAAKRSAVRYYGELLAK